MSFLNFRLVPKSVTLNDLERRNSRLCTVTEFGSLRDGLRKSEFSNNFIQLDQEI